jgi:hypothetical protein
MASESSIKNYIEAKQSWRTVKESVCIQVNDKDIAYCYKSIILPVVLCGYKTWSLTLREEHSLRVFENGVLRRIFGLKKEEVTGGQRTA